MHKKLFILNQKKRTAKRAYLLLELLIGFTLFSLLALPLIGIPMRSLKKERILLQQREIPRLAALGFADMYIKLCAEEIAWNDLSKDPVIDKKEQIQLLSGKTTRTISYFIKQEKKCEEDTDVRLVLIEVLFSSHLFEQKFFYKTCLVHLPVEKKGVDF